MTHPLPAAFADLQALADRYALPIERERHAERLKGPFADIKALYDAVLPRIGASITYFGTAVVRQFEQMDVYTPNTASGIGNSRDNGRFILVETNQIAGFSRIANS